MLIVSPYAKAGYTDSNTASVARVLAFVEHNFRLTALTPDGANAYDYDNSFDFTQTATPTRADMYLQAHPPRDFNGDDAGGLSDCATPLNPPSPARRRPDHRHRTRRATSRCAASAGQ